MEAATTTTTISHRCCSLGNKKMAGQHDVDRIPSSIISSTKMTQNDNISNSEQGDDQEIGSNLSNGGSTFATIR